MLQQAERADLGRPHGRSGAHRVGLRWRQRRHDDPGDHAEDRRQEGRHPADAGCRRHRPHGHGQRLLHGELHPAARDLPPARELPEREDRRRPTRRSPTSRRRSRTPTNDGKTYTFTIKDGAQWDAKSGPRQITGADAARGFKRLCNPVQPTGAKGYFAGVIDGMTEYCDAFAKVSPHHPRDQGLRREERDQGHHGRRQQRSPSSWSSRPVTSSTSWRCRSPARRRSSRSTTCRTAPSSARTSCPAARTRSPPTSRTSRSSSTATRRGRPTPTSSAPPTSTRSRSPRAPTRAPCSSSSRPAPPTCRGTPTCPTANVAALIARKDPQLALQDNGSTNPYMVINFNSPNAQGALKKLEVRQAINYAVNKKNIIQVLGGPDLNKPLGQILTPPLNGYKEFDPYATPDSAGDPAKAKQMLADAGYPNGLDLIYLYRNRGKAPAIATTLQADLKKAGINLKLKQVPPGRLLHPAPVRSRRPPRPATGTSRPPAGTRTGRATRPARSSCRCSTAASAARARRTTTATTTPRSTTSIDQALARVRRRQVRRPLAPGRREDRWRTPPGSPSRPARPRSTTASASATTTCSTFANNADITNVFLTDAS